MIDDKLLFNYNSPNRRVFNNQIRESDNAHNKLSDFMLNLDKLYKKKYKNSNIQIDYKILKDKPNKTKYAYVLRLINNIDMPCILNLYYNLKYINSKYDIVCFILDEDLYDSDSLNNKYLKYTKINDKYMKIILELFDVVISSCPIKICITDMVNYVDRVIYTRNNFFLINDLFFSFKDYFYDKYEKIIFLSHNVFINKNIDFLFDKYNKSVSSMDDNHYTITHSLTFTLLLIIPQKYYIEKFKYISQNMNDIFKSIFITAGLENMILYYTIFPNWNDKHFDKDIVNYNYKRLPNIDMNLSEKYFTDYYVDHFFAYNPTGFNGYNNNRSKFNLNDFIFEKWDKNVDRILKENPKYNYIFQYIQTYRETLFTIK